MSVPTPYEIVAALLSFPVEHRYEYEQGHCILCGEPLVSENVPIE